MKLLILKFSPAFYYLYLPENKISPIFPVLTSSHSVYDMSLSWPQVEN